MKKSNKAAPYAISQSRQMTRSLPHSVLSAITGAGQGDDPPSTGDGLVAGGTNNPPIIDGLRRSGAGTPIVR